MTQEVINATVQSEKAEGRCETCEYFDIGAMDKASGTADCYNRLAPHFQMHKDECCPYWVKGT